MALLLAISYSFCCAVVDEVVYCFVVLPVDLVFEILNASFDVYVLCCAHVLSTVLEIGGEQGQPEFLLVEGR